jgi:tetratricopeptide (TPR) repeat protein
MGFLNFWGGKSIRDHERKGDDLAVSGAWGRAKLEYESALEKLEQQPDRRAEDIARLQEKMGQCREKLARDHLETGMGLLDAGAVEEAREYLLLANELTRDAALKNELERQLEKADRSFTAALDTEYFQPPEPELIESDDPDTEDGDNYFAALVSTLPDEIQQAYAGFGPDFREGYMALNRGDFQRAAEKLEAALTENRQDAEYIRLELATAYLNLNRPQEARQLLEVFLEARPAVLPAYQMLCDILWEQQDYDQAETLLKRLPDELKASTAAHLLLGETYHRSGRYQEAIELYRGCLKKYGWSESVSKALALALESAGQYDAARRLYGKIMNECRGCHRRVDPFVKQRFAELSLDAGYHDSHILELYLSLAQEDPEHAAGYYRKISDIYSAKGNQREAQRFAWFADQLDR